MTETNTLIDISHRNKIMCGFAKRLNTELRKLRKERHRFQQGDLELKNAVTNISHDLRTPLTAISGYLDLLDNAEKSEEAERYIKVIRNRTEVLRQLTEELFCYSVVTSPEYDNDVEFVSVNSVLEESILGFYAVLQERNITPNISMRRIRCSVKLTGQLFPGIFSNLLNNAIKYSDGDLNITLNDYRGDYLFKYCFRFKWKWMLKSCLIGFIQLKMQKVNGSWFVYFKNTDRTDERNNICPI